MGDCGRCGVGNDDNKDGDCLVCHKMNDSELIQFIKGQRDALDKLINTPSVSEFLESVKLEAAHQRLRWPSEDDAVSVLRCQIERIVERASWRNSRYANFKRTDGWQCCEIYFENGQPKMQIRSKVETMEEAAIVATAIHLAIEWAMEEMQTPEFKAAFP